MYYKHLYLMTCFCLASINCHDITQPEGRIVEVNGQKMHVYEMGMAGNQTVIFDACLGANYLEWALVQPKVAEFAHAYSYDRAGAGWSSPSSLPRTSMNIISELRQLLQTANIQPPYILVGHSIGGVYMHLFANLFPNEVCGLVLVDSSHPNQVARYEELISQFNPPEQAIKRDLSWLPIDQHNLYEELYHNPIARTTGRREREAINTSFEQLALSENQLTNVPLVVVSRGTKVIDNADESRKPFELAWHKQWMLFQSDFLQKSAYSYQIIADGAGHMIQRDRPDLIIKAVEMVINLYKEQKTGSVV